MNLNTLELLALYSVFRVRVIYLVLLDYLVHRSVCTAFPWANHGGIRQEQAFLMCHVRLQSGSWLQVTRRRVAESSILQATLGLSPSTTISSHIHNPLGVFLT